jgi:hypothetical protein
VFLSIYNVLGQQVCVLVDDLRQAGLHQVIWDSRDGDGLEAASGIYFAKLQTGEATFIKKMLLIR